MKDEKVYPSLEKCEMSGDYYSVGGMSIRDYFAVHADNYDLALIMERDENVENTPIGRQATITREQARYIHADAMLKARNE